MSIQKAQKLTPFGDPVESDPYYGDTAGIAFTKFLENFGTDTPYMMGKGIQEFVVRTFFKDVTVRGVHNVPPYGPVIFVCGPHANQFLDGGIVTTFTPRKIGFVMAKSSVDKVYLGRIARLSGTIPVKRPQDYVRKGPGTVSVDPQSPLTLRGVGTEFSKLSRRFVITLPNKDKREVEKVISNTELILKTAFSDPASLELLSKGSAYRVTPHFDQNVVFAGVHERLISGGAIGIFPEGGSHDQPELLPLKAGVTLMALGAMAKQPGLDVKLVPTGLTYFNRDQFRSRAVLEFGQPVSVAPEFVEMYKKGGEERRKACDTLLGLVHDGLKAVTVNAPDYETLLAMQTIRRLYRPANRKFDASDNLELTRRLITAYRNFRDSQVDDIKRRVLAYNEKLVQLGIHDHQVNDTSVSTVFVAGRLLYRLAQLGLFATLSLPGALLTLPVGVVIGIVSERKRREAKAASSVKLTGQDVIATWKVLVAGAFIPTYLGLNTGAIVSYLVLKRHLSLSSGLAAAPLIFTSLSALGYFTYLMTERLFSIYRSIRPLTLALLQRDTTNKLRLERAALQHDINMIINQNGPKVIQNFNENRLVSKEESLYNEFISGQLALGKAPTEEESYRWVQANLHRTEQTKPSEVQATTPSIPDPRKDEPSKITEPRTSVFQASLQNIQKQAAAKGSDRELFAFDPEREEVSA
ncbi:hypothetical protein HDU93_006735 [Gonapodya sp. JEL0774]|nr:hypothetical protein HDU93_006735 [Gonapodya sp. JEL0774]